MLWMSKEDVNLFIEQVVREIAKTLSIANYEFENQKTLEDSISNKNQNVGVILDEFIKAYREWHDFYAVREEKGIQDKILTSEEETQRQKLIRNRDEKRQKLINKVTQTSVILMQKQNNENNMDDLHENAKENKKIAHKK